MPLFIWFLILYVRNYGLGFVLGPDTMTSITTAYFDGFTVPIFVPKSSKLRGIT